MEPLQQGNIRLAATLMLARDAPAGPEVFMMQRPARGDFPNLHVFPGGKVEGDDFAPALLAGLGEGRADSQLGVRGALRYWVAAIRECFEECGVLLAYRDGAPLRRKSEAEAARFDTYRHQLADGELSLEALCRREGLQLAADRLRYFGHWLTPPVLPRRFDTRFFITRMPAGQQTLAHPRELVGGAWIRPGDALDAAEQGRWGMVGPTLHCLRRIAPCGDVAGMLDAAASEQSAGRYVG